jgi:hypothetical protein
MTKQRNSRQQYAICIQSDDPDLLTPRMIYQILPDESAAKSNYVRVVDNEGEDYLYPADYFVLVDFPRATEQALARALVTLSQGSPAEHAAQTARAGGK